MNKITNIQDTPKRIQTIAYCTPFMRFDKMDTYIDKYDGRIMGIDAIKGQEGVEGKTSIIALYDANDKPIAHWTSDELLAHKGHEPIGKPSKDAGGLLATVSLWWRFPLHMFYTYKRKYFSKVPQPD